MKFDVEPSPQYIEHVSSVASDINKQLPSKLDEGDRSMEVIMLDSSEVNESVDVSQSPNDFKSCNLPNNIKNYKHESGLRNSPCLSATSEIDPIALEDMFYMDKVVTDDVKLPQLPVSAGASTAKDICIDEGAQAFENVSIDHDKVSDEEIFANLDMFRVKDSDFRIDETPEREISEDSMPSSTAEGLRSLGEMLQRNNVGRELAGPSNEYPAEEGCSGSLIDERRRLDAAEKIAFTLPSEQIMELRSHNSEEFTAENQDPRQKIDQVAEDDEDSTNMVSKRLFGEDDVSASTSDLEAEGTSIVAVGNKNKVLNNQLSFQSQNDDVGTEVVLSSGDDTTSARTSFSRLVRVDSDLLGPSHSHGSIATSTHVPYSGSTSFRSESSTTSTRSFAFPKLQAEWSNSSPVRMAKAKSRRLRKLHGWKSKLLCCKF